MLSDMMKLSLPDGRQELNHHTNFIISMMGQES